MLPELKNCIIMIFLEPVYQFTYEIGLYLSPLLDLLFRFNFNNLFPDTVETHVELILSRCFFNGVCLLFQNLKSLTLFH